MLLAVIDPDVTPVIVTLHGRTLVAWLSNEIGNKVGPPLPVSTITLTWPEDSQSDGGCPFSIRRTFTVELVLLSVKSARFCGKFLVIKVLFSWWEFSEFAGRSSIRVLMYGFDLG